MPDDPLVLRLLDEALDSGRTPEEVCAGYPELLDEVRARLRRLDCVRGELDALFPGAPVARADGAERPHVPGYEVEGVLGRGGMGVVFRARHLRLNRTVALKMIFAGAYAGPAERERFRREAEAAAALRHPNVIQVYDIGDAGGLPYLSMEYAEGGSLAEHLSGTPLPAHQAAALLAAVAGAVEAAHRVGIVHRDLKPANILMTADGVPKVSDFGLARRVSAEAGLTRTGAAVGTPSYMAPEQAEGRAGAAGPAADVYALGATLYEVLTGRAPFRAETAAETVRQVLSQDPVPPSRLNRTVPRSLETVCLKCLSKDPRHRYPSANALADDLGRFLNGEAVAARPEGWARRLARRAGRRPVLSAALLIAAASTLSLLAVGAWTLSERSVARSRAEAERAALETAAADDLADTSGHLRASNWPEARAALGRARVRLGDREADHLRRRIEQAEWELALAARLEAVRLERAVSTAEAPDWERSMAGYDAAFREAGVIQLPDDAAACAERINRLDIRGAVTDALDDWAFCVLLRDPRTREWLAEVAGRVDPDQSSWRAKAREQKRRPFEVVTEEVAAEGLRSVRCDPLLIGLGRDLQAHRLKDPVPHLTRVQQAFPNDLFANLELAEQLVWRNRPDEAVRYYQAALAVRPDAPAVCNKLALVLRLLGRRADAVGYSERAVRFAPESAQYRAALVRGLQADGRPDEARARARARPPVVARTARDHVALGELLEAADRPDDAVGAYRRAADLDRALPGPHERLRATLMRLGRAEEARVAWRAAIEQFPGQAMWYGYAEYCLFLGNDAEYRRARRDMLDRFADVRDPLLAERTGRGGLLLPAAGRELDRAVALARRAAAVDRNRAAGYFPYFQFAGGLAEYRQGRFDRAAAVMRGDAAGVLGPAPRLVLAMALHKQGDATAARKELAAAVLSYDWRPHRVQDQDDWIYHVLRREAEGEILPDLPRFLAGEHRPRDNDERLGCVGVCQFTDRPLTAARLYADAFTADPRLAEDFRAGHRAAAAASAARAGCGRGGDPVGLSETERAEWRTRAREWLRADLAAWEGALKADPAAHGLLKRALSLWRADPDLAGVRAPGELEKLSAGERGEWAAFWDRVERVSQRAAGGR